MRNYDRLIKKIKWTSRLCAIAIIAVLVICACLPLAWYFKLPIALLAVLALFVAMSLKISRMGRSPLMDDLNPYQYHYVMHQSGLALQDGVVDIATAFAAGEYALCVELCQRLAREAKKERMRIRALYNLMLTYAAMKEYEALRVVLTDLRAQIAAKKRSPRELQMWEKALAPVQAILDEDYGECLRFARERLALPAKKSNAYFAADARFDAAEALYMLGHTAQARADFEAVAAAAPLLAIGQQALVYLQQIDAGEVPHPVIPAPQSAEGVKFPVGGLPGQQKKKPGAGRWIVFVVCLLVLFAVISSLARDARGRETPLAEIEAQGYDVVELCHVIPVGEEGDVLCLFVADESYIGTETWEQEIYHTPYVMYLSENKGYYKYEIEVGLLTEAVDERYTLSIADADLEICMALFAHEGEIPQGKDAYPFSIGDHTYYFCILELTSTPVRFNGCRY